MLPRHIGPFTSIHFVAHTARILLCVAEFVQRIRRNCTRHPPECAIVRSFMAASRLSPISNYNAPRLMQSAARTLANSTRSMAVYTPSGVPCTGCIPPHTTDVSSAVFHATKSSKKRCEEKYVRDTIPHRANIVLSNSFGGRPSHFMQCEDGTFSSLPVATASSHTLPIRDIHSKWCTGVGRPG